LKLEDKMFRGRDLMPVAESEILLDVSSDKLKEILTNLEFVGKSLGIVDDVTIIDNKKTIWHLKSQQVRITRTKTVEAKLLQVSPREVVWEAKGGNLIIRGECSISDADNKSRLKIKLEFDLKGPLGTIFRPMISMTLNSRLENFMNHLKEELEKFLNTEN